MESLRRTPVRVAIIVVLLFSVVLAQNAAASLLPSGSSAQTGRLIGRAGFAYLSGIRTFAAAVLWNRLEPQYHKYYSDKSLEENVELLPTMSLVQTLDPQFIEAYYYAAWVVARRGDMGTALDLARKGIRENPHSGLLKASYIQLLLLEGEDTYRDEIISTADAATASDTVWLDDAQKLEGYAVARAAYHILGLSTEG